MSRTKKDRPYWVRLNDPTEARTPYHYHHGSRWFNNGYKGNAESDYCCIDEEYTGTDWRRSCGYYLGYRRHVCVIPKNAVRDMYYSPMRNDERMVLRNALKDYNTFAEVDEDMYLNEKSRHATYGGGYWD
jgi:hypothetical protein